MKTLLLISLLIVTSCGKNGLNKPGQGYCKDRNYMIMQCMAEASRDFPDLSLRDYHETVCNGIYPVGNNCWEERENYYY